MTVTIRLNNDGTIRMESNEVTQPLRVFTLTVVGDLFSIFHLMTKNK